MKKDTKIGILSIGNEVVDGRIVNTNAVKLAKKLKTHGFTPHLVSSCRDEKHEIIECLHFLSLRCKHIITSGGLGPTTDDLTRDAIAAFTKTDLIEDHIQLEKLQQYYTSRDRELDTQSRTQAIFPKTATVIDNPFGTAPGFITPVNTNQNIYSAPGVPKELFGLFDSTILPSLLELEKDHITLKQSHYFHCFGVAESVAGKIVSDLKLPESITIGYRPHFPELEIRIESLQGCKDFTGAQQQIREALSDFIFSEKELSSLPLKIHELLLKHRHTISVFESCTGGLLGKLLTDLPGSSSYFLGGYTCYANQIKENALEIPNKLLVEKGAVSSEVAELMAKNGRERFQSDIALSITGIAGPDGGTEEKPVGLFYVGVSYQDINFAKEFHLPIKNRDSVRTYAAYSALNELRNLICA